MISQKAFWLANSENFLTLANQNDPILGNHLWGIDLLRNQLTYDSAIKY